MLVETSYWSCLPPLVLRISPAPGRRGQGAVRSDYAPNVGTALAQTIRTMVRRSRSPSGQPWVDTMIKDPGTDIGTTAKRETWPTHVRFLAPLAYLSLSIIEAIAEGR